MLSGLKKKQQPMLKQCQIEKREFKVFILPQLGKLGKNFETLVTYLRAIISVCIYIESVTNPFNRIKMLEYYSQNRSDFRCRVSTSFLFTLQVEKLF